MSQWLTLLDLLELKINLIINIGAKSWQSWPVSRTMSFHKDVILLLLFMCWSYDVIFVALDAILWIRLARERTKMSSYLNYRISSIRRNRNTCNMKFDKRTVPFEDTNWSVIEISTRNVTSNRKSSKTWVRAKEIRYSTKERLLWRRKSTSRLIECPIFQSPLEHIGLG